ncbi:hypothetical protein NCCP1664_09800 [Zafaria cholistanensis]|uniref:Uncharacterized protein n=1 Tax=Zafaria cholistanensis TaxID=1682741 RepID=A0A5A7NNF4_9MICC|nr:hypothetical protein NCCP1664_09800 [Zafaria cholistanensis]
MEAIQDVQEAFAGDDVGPLDPVRRQGVDDDVAGRLGRRAHNLRARRRLLNLRHVVASLAFELAASAAAGRARAPAGYVSVIWPKLQDGNGYPRVQRAMER